MTHLRQRMIDDMSVRGLSENNKKSYVALDQVVAPGCERPPARGPRSRPWHGLETPASRGSEILEARLRIRWARQRWALGPGKALLDRANESRRSIGDDQQRILESAQQS